MSEIAKKIAASTSRANEAPGGGSDAATIEEETMEREKREGEISPMLLSYVKHLESLTANLDQARKERKKYTRKIFWGIVVWLVIVMAITILDGIQCIPFKLPDYALVALISATGIATTGMVIAVMASMSKGHGGAFTEQHYLSALSNVVSKATTQSAK
ncbi:MAG: hypothetical protein OXU31_03185 [Gammaproteobacteria bacterium]|nr:hypothetical protein [Gammaproteobacteria bacterium]MDD9800609.1 hypothetical protein [Gammaproteobacteria bacterium]MDD9814975.1 hypothetical protein [Gammaproteobacteria bacterium]MDD9850899.1 hypothetical protein [Gammaproteobacteria bacterium]MDD9870451.1 hypothetical protein [Gammaproteobacteria bacterium]